MLRCEDRVLANRASIDRPLVFSPVAARQQMRKGQKESGRLQTTDSCLLSSNYPIRPRQYVRRYREAELLGGFQIDHQLEFGRLFDRQSGRLYALQNFGDGYGGAAIQVRKVRAIGRESTRIDKIA